MKITDVETILIKNIQPYRGGRYWLFVQLITDEGIIGLGERPSGNATNLDAQISLIKNLCQQFAIGTSPFDIESLWQRIFASRHDYRQHGRSPLRPHRTPHVLRSRRRGRRSATRHMLAEFSDSGI